MIGFDNIIGHKEQIDFLVKTYETGKLSHSYIFEGVSGIGKKNDWDGLCRNDFWFW